MTLGTLAGESDSAEAFLRSDRLHDTHCLISDVQMPGMNGIELQDELIVQGHRLPIIFVTAFPEMKARARAFAADAICFLGKELITCLNKALPERSV
jgi:FixJ family two-component response regulator